TRDIPCLKQDCSCAFRSKSCCCANPDLQNLRDEARDAFKTIFGRISQLSHEGHEVNRSKRGLTNVSICYDDIRLNDGSGYNSLLGAFTAPVSGVYFFSLSVYSRLLRAGQHMFHIVQLMRNGRAQVVVWEDNTEDMEDSSSQRVLLSLVQGDQVYAGLVHDRQLCGNSRGLNSFFGYLVYPLPATSL
uniref:Cerebellin 18 n=1 Tax=Neogobius melanostomus TaxID=47308 RepID=A0A8C6UAA6_9GOBI